MKRLVLATIAITALGTKLVMSRGAAPPPELAPAPPPPPIVFSIPAPSLVMVHEAAPTPAPAPAPAPAPIPLVTSRAPVLDATCVIPLEGVGEMNSCSWDTGFPAISADGKTIVVELHPGDGGRGYPAYDIEFIDVANPRKRTAHPILIADEYTAPDDPLAPAVRAKIHARIATVKRTLDRGGYRSLARLGSKNDPLTGAPGFRGEFDEESARVIDAASNTVVWERRFDVTREFKPRVIREDEEGSCTPTATSDISLAFDPETRTLLALVDYIGGPCWCDAVTLAYTDRVR